MRFMMLAPVIALLAAACTTTPSLTADSFDEPGESEIRALFASELHADPWFMASAPGATGEARRITAMFHTELAAVRKHHCTATRGRAGLVCTFEVVLRFPNLRDRESRSVWERRFYRDGDRWVMLRGAD